MSFYMFKYMLCATFILCVLNGCTQPLKNDYLNDIAKLKRQSERIEDKLHGASNISTDKPHLYMRLLDIYHKKAMLTKQPKDFQQVELLLEQNLDNNPAWLYAKANFAASIHRFSQAKSLLAQLPSTYQTSPSALALKADIALQLGEYAEAEKHLQYLNEHHPSWDNLVRLAFYKMNTNEMTIAKELYRQAADKVSAKQMFQYAWINLQQGLLELEAGKPRQALAFYTIADKAYSGYWLIQEHIAEALQLIGEPEQAKQIYLSIIKTNPKGEILFKLAQLESNVQQKQDYVKRANLILQAAAQLYPEATTGHTIELYLEQNVLPTNLLQLSLKNYQIRPNTEAAILLATTYLKLNMYSQAMTLKNKITNSPWHNTKTALFTQRLNDYEANNIK